MRIGLISDTHGLLRPEAEAALARVTCLVHAGDIGNMEVLERLAAIAPVTAIRGNNDTGPWASALEETAVLRVEGHAIYVLHDLKELRIDPAAEGFSVVVSGHSHKPHITSKDGVLYVNPGSAGPRRFKLPITVGTLEITGMHVRAHIHELSC